jgi:hypothetical protein
MTTTTLTAAQEVEQALSVLDNNGVIHEDEARSLFTTYLELVVGTTYEEWLENN